MVVISDIRSMFWGVTIDAGKRYSQTVTNSFHLSMAALEPGSGNEFVQVMTQHSSSEFLLCSLQQGKLLQQPLDLIFAEGEEVSFSLVGKGIVHLTGYLLPDPPEEDFSDEDSDEDSDVPQLIEMEADDRKAGQKRKALEAGSPAKKKKLLESFDEDDYDSEEDEDYEANEDSDDDNDEDDEEFSEDDLTFDEDEDDEDEEEPSDEESPAKQKQIIETPKSDKKKKAKETKDTPKTPKTPGSATQTPQKSPETPSTPANGESSKKKKKKKKKSKDGSPSPSDQSMVESTPKSATKGKDKTPTAAKGDTPKSASKEKKDNTPSKAETPGKRKVVTGGTVVEDMKVGHGPEAKSGKMVSVYYVGTLAKNNKRFDSCTSGKPFRFRLKQGEVIKGWDNGVEGMKVGGKRKITVPANQGYGSQRQGPIPPNSSLTFEVELKAVS